MRRCAPPPDSEDMDRLVDIRESTIDKLDFIAWEISAISTDLKRLLPEAKFWRWQVEAILPLALEMAQKLSREVAKTSPVEDQEQAMRAYIKALEFVKNTQEVVVGCNRIIAKWNWRVPWAMACCEELHEVLCRFPDITIPVDVRQYAPIRRKVM